MRIRRNRNTYTGQVVTRDVADVGQSMCDPRATGGYEGHRRLLNRITVADRTLQ